MNQSIYPYQVKGVEHLISKPFNRPHALLADAPGTGKTIMDIEAKKVTNCKNGIILCPAIIKEQWRRQMIDWKLCDPDEIQVLYGLDAQLDNTPWKVLNYDLVREKSIGRQLAERKWHVLTMDEAHRLKTHDSQQTHAVFNKSFGIANQCYYKWALSGSIMPNRPIELYPMLKTMAPEVLGEYDTIHKYGQRYCGGAFMQYKGASHIPELTARLQPFMLRRELQDVWAECPPVIDNVVWLDVPFQSHPEWTGEGFMQEATERRIVAEAKIPFIEAYLRDRLESGVDKIVCFTYHRAVIDQLVVALAKYKPQKIYGGISKNKRDESLAKFDQNPDVRLFLIQISSGGEGLDGLQRTCAEYVNAEPEWSPGREDQAGRRILRLGQKRTVISTTLLASNSYEETIYFSNQRKRKVIEVVCKPNGGNYTMADDLNRIATALEAFVPLAGLLTQVLSAGLQQPAFQPQQFAPPTEVQAPPAPLALVPLSVPAVAQTAPVASATPVGIVPTASQPITSNVVSFSSRDDFQKKVIDKLSPHGQDGLSKLAALNAHFGVSRLGELPENQFEQFFGMLG